MSKELDEALVSVINTSSSMLQNGISFLNKQVPDVINQLITWKITESILYITICLCILGATYPINKGIFKKVKHRPHDQWEIAYVWNIIPLWTLVPFFNNILELFKLLFAPKIFLIEYAATIIK